MLSFVNEGLLGLSGELNHWLDGVAEWIALWMD